MHISFYFQNQSAPNNYLEKYPSKIYSQEIYLLNKIPGKKINVDMENLYISSKLDIFLNKGNT